jgi:hypothetical protein
MKKGKKKLPPEKRLRLVKTQIFGPGDIAKRLRKKKKGK